MRRRSPPTSLSTTAATLLIITLIAVSPANGDTTLLPPIEVVAPAAAPSDLDQPMSMTRIGAARVRAAQPLVNLSETLVTVPGVVANNRQNYAQDLHISIRGFGARSTFGLRGIRLYMDGIPVSMPDGQGQVSNFDLGSAAGIEVLRGAFSALYGNASGGVVNISTEHGPAEPTLTADAEYGRYGSRRQGLKFGQQAGRVNYVASASHFETDGFREHSAARRDLVHAKLRVELDPRSSLSLIANHIDQPYAQDPLGLDRQQLAQDREQAGSNALAYDSRKSFTNGVGGLIYETHPGERDHIRLTAYLGDRQVQQFLAVPRTAQLAPTSAGGVIDLDRTFGGLDARWTRELNIAQRPSKLTVGSSYDVLHEGRQGYNNFERDSTGVIGERRRDEANRVFSFDQYVQGETRLSDQWAVKLGLRHSRVAFRSNDRFLANGDDSGRVTYGNMASTAGVLYQPHGALSLYANIGRGIETPTFNELAYRLGAQGLNLDLRAARSLQTELGAKLLLPQDSRLDLAVFSVDTRDDLAVLQNTGGRAVYQNVDKTERRGVELAYDRHWGRGFSTLLAYTYLDAQFAAAFQTCRPVTPCLFPAVNTATVIAGNRVPGVPRQNVYAELAWQNAAKNIDTALEMRGSGRVYANDINSEYASGYAVVHWRVQFKQQRGRLSLQEFLRIDNLFGRDYVASLIVNEANGRYYEPAPGRSPFVGLALGYAF